jgi:hypothetical protein
LGYAKRSAAETRSHIHAGYDRGYFTETEYKDYIQKATEIAKQFSGLIRYIRSKQQQKRQLFATCNLQPATNLSEHS